MSHFVDEMSDQLNLRWAWDKVRREATPGDIWFDEVELAAFDIELEKNLRGIAAELRTGRYRMKAIRPLPFPKHPDKDGNPRVRQAFQVAVRDQVAWTALVNIVGPHVDSVVGKSCADYIRRGNLLEITTFMFSMLAGTGDSV